MEFLSLGQNFGEALRPLLLKGIEFTLIHAKSG